jgi:beta-lactamase regulating signal transducer with metallopeptidase domain
MNLDNRSLSLLAIQMLVLSAIGGASLLLRTSATTRVWCIRLTILSVLGVTIFSQLPAAGSLPAQRLIMLPPQMDAVSAVDHQLAKIAPASRGRAAVATASVMTPPVPFAISILQVWLAGVLLGLAWLAFVTVKLRRFRINSTAHGSFKGLEIRLSSEAASPLVAGMLRPTLFLPTNSIDRLTSDQLQSVLAHEHAHVEHRDLPWKAIHRLACILLWPNLPLWLLLSPHDHAMEDLADAKAALATATPERYAALLLSIAEHRVGRDTPLALAMARKHSNIGRRIKRILAGEALKDLAPIHKGARIAMSFVALVCLGGLLVGFGWQKEAAKASNDPWQHPTGTCDTYILAPDGGPAKGAKAWLRIETANYGDSPHFESITVDGNVVHIDFAKYSDARAIQILAKDDQGNIGIVSAEPGKQIDLKLLETCTAKGRMVGFDGSPEAGAVVTTLIAMIQNYGGRPFIQFKGSPLASRATTDQNGNFELSGIPKNSIIQIDLSDPAVQQPMKKITVGNGWSCGFQVGAAPINDLGQISLKKAAQVSGRVVLDGNGVPGVRVAAQIINSDMIPDRGTPGDEVKSSWGEAQTDADGNYLIGGLSDARYNIALFLDKDMIVRYAAPAKDSLVLHEGLITNQDFALAPGGLIEGDVILKSKAKMDGFPVAYYGPDHPTSGAACGGTSCDAKGHFKFRVSPGQYHVYMAAPAATHSTETERSHSDATVIVVAGKTVHLTLKG